MHTESLLPGGAAQSAAGGQALAADVEPLGAEEDPEDRADFASLAAVYLASDA